MRRSELSAGCRWCGRDFPPDTEHGGRLPHGRAWTCGPDGYREHGLYFAAVHPQVGWWRKLLRRSH